MPPRTILRAERRLFKLDARHSLLNHSFVTAANFLLSAIRITRWRRLTVWSWLGKYEAQETCLIASNHDDEQNFKARYCVSPLTSPPLRFFLDQVRSSTEWVGCETNVGSLELVVLSGTIIAICCLAPCLALDINKKQTVTGGGDRTLDIPRDYV